MKKIIILALVTLTLVGCGEPQAKYINEGVLYNWEQFNTEGHEEHVIFAFNKNGCFSDGSREGNGLYQAYMERAKGVE